MKPLNSLLTLEELKDLSSRSHFRYGQAIADAGDVQIHEKKTFRIEARVKHGDGQRRTVMLESTPNGLRWKCTCSSRKGFFCQHCVAVGLANLAGKSKSSE
ncbi:MAG: hypothetical protein ABI643_01520 [Candidatus Doudnabacteria bacterium]